MVKEERILAEIAYRYYIEKLNQSQISKKYNIGRSTISRMLKEAREKNIVEIKINAFDSEIIEVKNRLQKKYNLDYLEISTNDEKDTERLKNKNLATTSSQVVKNLLEDNQNIGISWGDTLAQTIKQMDSKTLESSNLIPLVGGPTATDVHTHVNTIIYELASKTNANPYYVNATVIQEDKKVKEGIMQSQYFEETINYWSNIDLAIVGVGGTLSTKMSNWRELLTEDDYELLKLDGAIGDVCCRFIDRNGFILKGDLHDRTIGIEIEKLKKVPLRLAIARGKDKVSALKALLKTNIISALVTDLETAKAL